MQFSDQMNSKSLWNERRRRSEDKDYPTQSLQDPKGSFPFSNTSTSASFLKIMTTMIPFISSLSSPNSKNFLILRIQKLVEGSENRELRNTPSSRIFFRLRGWLEAAVTFHSGKECNLLLHLVVNLARQHNMWKASRTNLPSFFFSKKELLCFVF
ncbi:hypothetical protein M5K25_024097 [Dendrobium thyrsiflorum]|uniref:Uncharacterized protein n=1 Tax=Dendrobium thyrsiflorum TaxID=117978 RepID=A0ABD0U0X5_DENTH